MQPQPPAEPREPAAGSHPFRRPLAVLWPAFAMASVMEGLVFATVDPVAILTSHAGLQSWSPNTLCSVSFFVFWGVIATAGFITRVLDAPGD